MGEVRPFCDGQSELKKDKNNQVRKVNGTALGALDLILGLSCWNGCSPH